MSLSDESEHADQIVNPSDFDKAFRPPTELDHLGPVDHMGMVRSDNPSDAISQLNQRPQGNPKVQGSVPILEERMASRQIKPNPANNSSKSTVQQSSTSGNSQPGQGTDNLAKEAVQQATEQAAKRVSLQTARQAALTAARTAATALAPYTVPIIGCLIGFVVIIILALALFAVFSNGEGDRAKQVGVNMTGRLGKDVHCKEMVDTLVMPSKVGRGSITLTLHETSGGFSPEGGATFKDGLVVMGDPAANDPMKGNPNDVGHALAMSSEIKGKIQMEELPFYVTARWLFSGNYLLAGMKVPTRGLPNKKNFAGQKVMFYNPKNGKAAIGIIAEVGPANSVTDRFAGGPMKGSYDTYNKRHNTDYKSLGDVLDVDSADRVIMSFLDPEIARDPVKGKVGLTTCTVVEAQTTGNKVSNDRDKGNVGTPKFVEGVPAVGQPVGSKYCNQVTAVMTAVYFKPSLASSLITTSPNSFPTENRKEYCSIKTNGTYDFINTKLAGTKDVSGKSITYHNTKSKPTIQDIKKSIDSGNPVLAVMGKTKLLSSTQHFVLVVGYDDKYFYINDPYPWGGGVIHVYTNRGHSPSHNLLEQQKFIDDIKSENTGGYYAVMRDS